MTVKQCSKNDLHNRVVPDGITLVTWGWRWSHQCPVVAGRGPVPCCPSSSSWSRPVMLCCMLGRFWVLCVHVHVYCARGISLIRCLSVFLPLSTHPSLSLSLPLCLSPSLSYCYSFYLNFTFLCISHSFSFNLSPSLLLSFSPPLLLSSPSLSSLLALLWSPLKVSAGRLVQRSDY